MKKIMMLVAVAACALGVQAASVDWSFSEVVKNSASHTDLSSYTAYLFTDASYQAMLGNVVDGKLDKSFFNGFIGSKQINVNTAATVTTFNTGASVVVTTSELLTGDSCWIVIADLEGGDAFSKVINPSVYDETVSPTPSHTAGNWNISKVNTAAYLSSNTAAFEIVPEPTSGLLMLLGMGALALRRRRA